MATPNSPSVQFSVVPVRDIPLEAAVLSRLINERYAAMQVLHMLSEECFYDANHLRLYKAIVSLDKAGKEIDMLSVNDELHNTLSPEEAQMLVAETAASVFASDEILRLDYMVLRLQEYAKRRALGFVAEKIMKLHSDMTVSLDEGIKDIQEKLDSTIMGSADSFVTLSQKLDDLLQIIEDNQNEKTRHEGLLSGLAKVDEQGGLPSDGLVVVGAKSSHGKTTFATTVALNALKTGRSVAFYSMEMSMQKVSSRILSMECGVNSNAIQRLKLSPAERDRALQTISQLKDGIAKRFFFDNRNIRDLDAITMSIRAMKKNRNVDCVVIDYLQLMDASPGSKFENTNKLLGGIAHRLHELAQDLHITILLLSQINRAVVGEPNMSHLRDSGEIAEAADMVIILYNADFEHASLPKPYDKFDPKNLLLVKLEKNRDGATMEFLMGFSASETRIYAVEEASLPLKQPDLL